jgi:general secretion pathway protein C
MADERRAVRGTGWQRKALNDNRPMAARLSAFIVWAALAASAVFWVLRLAGGSPAAPSHTVPVGDVIVPHADLTRLFGVEPKPAAQADAPPPPMSSRFKLIGVAAPRLAGAPGVALISVDGKTPRAYRIGSVVDNDLVLQSVEPRSVSLGLRGRTSVVRLELPPLPSAATGTLPPPVNQDTPSAPMPAMAQPPAPAPTPQVVPIPPPQQPPVSSQGAMQQPLAVNPGNLPIPQPGARPSNTVRPMPGVSPTGANPSLTQEAPMPMPGAPAAQ